MVLLLRLLVGVAARVRAGQPAAQARILGKLGPQPLEYGTGFGLAPEGVERVGREPAAAEAQPWLVGRGPEPAEDFEGTCEVRASGARPPRREGRRSVSAPPTAGAHALRQQYRARPRLPRARPRPTAQRPASRPWRAGSASPRPAPRTRLGA